MAKARRDGMSLDEWLVRDRLDEVRAWLDDVERRAVRSEMTDEDMLRVDGVAGAVSGPLDLRWRRALAVRIVARWLRERRTAAPTALRDALARVDEAFGGLTLDAALERILRGTTGARPWGKLQVTAYAAQQCGALDLADSTLDGAARLLRDALPEERERREQRAAHAQRKREQARERKKRQRASRSRAE